MASDLFAAGRSPSLLLAAAVPSYGARIHGRRAPACGHGEAALSSLLEPPDAWRAGGGVPIWRGCADASHHSGRKRTRTTA
uniref:Uncharacterized protein n=1 Tax=Setaria viridis TaxID=4556 RepID=A0A4U6VBI7_SETVI|nr:hypothetical protein SEVIR_3G211000v2 [Setaria viridis]